MMMAGLLGMSQSGTAAERSALSADQVDVCTRLGLDKTAVSKLVNKPLFKFTEAEVDTYLRFLSAAEPDLRARIVHLARKNIGQPYELYLLGEMPFEPYDPQPLYCLGKSDCLVFTEHTYAMALSRNWPGFMKMLQRIRYRDGLLGVATRNHYTEADWNVSNNWLVEDITSRLAGEAGVTFEQAIDRAKFLRNRYGLEVDVPVVRHRDVYLPFEYVERAKPELRDGDFVNVVRGVVPARIPSRNQGGEKDDPSEIFGGNAFVGHVGLIVCGDNGEVHMIHSSVPAVREESLDEYIARSTEGAAARDAEGKPRLLGFKFLRLRENPLEGLRAVDGDDAPRVTLPSGSEAQF
jgi:hypothetical protein